MHWPSRQLGETDLIVGPCAWRIDMLTDDAAAAFVRTHPSLIVAAADDADALLSAAASRLGDLPVMLLVEEPTFVRRLESEIRRRASLMGREHLAAVMLLVDDPADLKGGGMLQVLFELRQNGFCDHLGLGHRDARHVEWLARSTAVRLLGVSYQLDDQQVAYRALEAAADFGLAPIALAPPPVDDREAIRFALGSAARVLPVIDRAGYDHLPDTIPMGETELENCWQEYQTTHNEPAALLRSQPPD